MVVQGPPLGYSLISEGLFGLPFRLLSFRTFHQVNPPHRNRRYTCCDSEGVNEGEDGSDSAPFSIEVESEVG